jgi:hypothetical protein
VDYFSPVKREAKVSVTIPFASSFRRRWHNIFKPAINTLGLHPVRADERRVGDSISVLDVVLLEFLPIVGAQETFDLPVFNPDRKGLSRLITRDYNEPELRALGRRLIDLGILEASS